MFRKFRKKPLVIEAVQFKSATIASFEGMEGIKVSSNDYSSVLYVKTLEGEMVCNLGDWVIRGIKGELYPIKDHIFRESYEAYE